MKNNQFDVIGSGMLIWNLNGIPPLFHIAIGYALDSWTRTV